MGCVMEWNDCEWLLRRNVFDCCWLNWWTCLMTIGMKYDKLVNMLWMIVGMKWMFDCGMWLKRLKWNWRGMKSWKEVVEWIDNMVWLYDWMKWFIVWLWLA